MHDDLGYTGVSKYRSVVPISMQTGIATPHPKHMLAVDFFFAYLILCI